MLIRRLITYSLLSLVALGGFFGNIHIETEKSGIQIVSISYEENGVYAFECQAGMQETANGQGCEAKNTTSADQLKMWNSVIDSLNIILGVITAIVSPAIMFAGWLMSPDWTSGDLFGLRTPMYTLWVTVSNIVYFVYAILLILIALGTMFGKESFSYKVMLPKLALGILMVPFTWWFVQWTISLSAIVTASVITIPAETMANLDKDGKSWMSTPSIPKNITINDDSFKKDSNIDTTKTKCDGTDCIAPIDVINKSAGMYGYMMVYAYSVFKFQEVKNLPQGLDIIKTGLGIVHQGIVAAIMFLVFGLLTLALVAMLLVRAIKLWIYAIFSPLFTFQFVAGASMMGGDKDTFTIKEFVGLCFVPAIVGLSLSFGLIMINAVGSGTTGNQTEQCTSALIQGDGCKMISIASNPENSIIRKIEKFGTNEAKTINIIKFGGVTTRFEGKAKAGIDPAVEASAASGAMSVLNSAGGMFGTLIIDIIALVFIWMAFMAAKNVSKAVQVAVKPFEDIGNQVGSLAKKIPQYTPIPGLGMSANSMGKVVNNAENAMIGASDKKFKESAAGKLFGGDKVVAQVDEKRLADALKDAGTSATHPTAWAKAGEVIEKQNGKDIEYSSLFKDLAGGLKGLANDTERKTALEKAGYSSANAQSIVEQLKKHSGELDKNDTTLMTALKSRIGAPAGGAQNGATGFTQSTVKDTSGKEETKISLGDIRLNVEAGGTLSKDNIDKLVKEGTKKWTQEEFEKNISSFTSDVQAGIKKAITNPSDFYKPKP